MSKETILITGATGSIGKELIKQLLLKNIRFRIGVRTTDTQTCPKTDNYSSVFFDYEKPSTFENAFRGIREVFLVTPLSYSRLDELLVPAISFAKKSGIKHLVSLGSTGFEQGTDMPLTVAEKCVQNSGLNFTILRPNILMQNFDGLIKTAISGDKKVCLPIGDARVSFVDLRDVCGAIINSLTDKVHKNKVYTLTGKKAFNLNDIFHLVSKNLNCSITYVPASVDQCINNLIEKGWDRKNADLLITLFDVARYGWCEEVSDDLKSIINREPIHFEQFIEDYHDRWV
jgi:uncharacterized protein YbjT (DUF2867 family)